MSRSITSLGIEWPANVQASETFDTNWTYDASLPQNGIDWRMFQHQCFTWLATADEDNTTIAAGDNRSFQVVMPDENGDDKLVKVTPQRPERQTVINNEMSGIIWRQDWAELGLPDLVRLMQDDDGSTFCRIEAIRTPDSIVDKVRGVNETFQITAIDYDAKTITFEGKPYYRKRKTTAVDDAGEPVYDIGLHMGMSRYMRDQLSSDAHRLIDGFKYREYDYGFMEYQGTEYRYDSIVDSPATDLRIGPYPTDDPATLTEKYTVHPIYPSSHVVRFQTLPEGAAVGDTMTLLRRLPAVTSMGSTTGVFSQQYGYWDVRWRFARHNRQFSAGFLMTNHRETNKRAFDEKKKKVEVDMEELPGATTVFMNTHRPTGGTDPDDDMLNYAARNGLDAVMDGFEWTESDKQQHQILIPFDSPDYVDPYQWHDTRIAIWPPGNPYGYPANSVTWHERAQDGKFKFACGCLMSPDANTPDGILNHLQTYLCNPVDGDFVADMEFFAPGAQPDIEEFPIHFDIKHMKVSQFKGWEAGGTGLPAPDGRYPNGLRPYADDKTKTSGTGTVTVTGSAGTQTVISSFEQITYNDEPVYRNDGSRLLRPVTE